MIQEKTDIVIVGSGISGFAASLAAAKEGKSVLMIEKSNSIGGDSTQTNVGTICGSFLRSFSGQPKPVGYSFCHDFLSELQLICPVAKPTLYHEGLYIIPYEWTALQQLMKTKLEENGVTVLTNTELVGVNRIENEIQDITLQTPTQQINIKLNSIIDCSGNGIVSQLAKVSLIQEKSYQAASQIFRVQNIEIDNEFTLNMSIKRMMMQEIKENNWPENYLSLSAVPGSLRNHSVDLKITLGETVTDSIEKNKAIQAKAHQSIHQIFPHLQQQLLSFENASIEYIFPSLGIRVEQRSKGKYILTEDDVLQCKKSKTGIAIGAWPIEEWTNDGKLNLEYFETDTGYDIPANCLISEEVSNLSFAGKNISASSRAIASARVMGTGLQTGYAAGKLACSKDQSHQSEIVNTLYHELHIA
ncbi:MAG TPA: FAD-dependent oxidoreductase [Chryseolinea sp.]|nr:FAD-dependent oxidoreductase [Chryseolinea sp.]HPH47599.1 FAD-dependent oxidoreductase [Chryseolinea sp.]HPM30117.1 FAD-dependent oxidoreductase [Chryseolinea sp.]